MEKLFAAVSLGQSIYGRWLFRKLLYGAVVGLSLTIVTSTITGAMLVGGFYAAYLALLHSGMDAGQGLIIVGSAALLTTLVLIVITLWYLRRLRGMPRRLLAEKIPQISQAGSVVDAFIVGLLGKRLE